VPSDDGEPNNYGESEDSLLFDHPDPRVEGKTWNDVNGTYMESGYVIEYE
jgi:hypothetical protein